MASVDYNGSMKYYFLLQTGTLKLIWALGDSDPASVSSLNSADYHGNRRGTAIRRLLDPAGPPPTLPDDAISVDFEQQNVRNRWKILCRFYICDVSFHWPFEGNPSVTGGFLSERVCKCSALVLSLMLAWISCWTNSRVVSDLGLMWRHCNCISLQTRQHFKVINCSSRAIF